MRYTALGFPDNAVAVDRMALTGDIDSQAAAQNFSGYTMIDIGQQNSN